MTPTDVYTLEFALALAIVIGYLFYRGFFMHKKFPQQQKNVQDTNDISNYDDHTEDTDTDSSGVIEVLKKFMSETNHDKTVQSNLNDKIMVYLYLVKHPNATADEVVQKLHIEKGKCEVLINKFSRF